MSKVVLGDMDLSDFETWELVEELERREGVRNEKVAPYDGYEFLIDDDVKEKGVGPVTVLTVFD